MLRDAQPDDLTRILELNEAAVPTVNSVPLSRMAWFLDVAPYFRVAEVDNDIAGFLIGLVPGIDYVSMYYRWFCDRYEHFAYIDRVVVAERNRGQRIGWQFYTDFLRFAKENRAPCLVCEVNVEPPNPGSMAFHKAFGFDQISTLSNEDGSKVVATMNRDV